MTWQVICTPTAEEDLAAVWLAAPAYPNAITAAANKIDSLLAANPEMLGDISFDTVRVVEVHPLGAEYEVVAANHTVWVLSKWDTVKQGPP